MGLETTLAEHKKQKNWKNRNRRRTEGKRKRAAHTAAESEQIAQDAPGSGVVPVPVPVPGAVNWELGGANCELWTVNCELENGHEQLLATLALRPWQSARYCLCVCVLAASQLLLFEWPHSWYAQKKKK